MLSLPPAHRNVYLQTQRQEKVNHLRSSIPVGEPLHAEARSALQAGISGYQQEIGLSYLRKMLSQKNADLEVRTPQGWSWSAPVLRSSGVSCLTAADLMYLWIKDLERHLLKSSFGYRVERVAQSVLDSTVFMLLGDYEETFALNCLFFFCVCDLLLIQDPDTKTDCDVLH